MPETWLVRTDSSSKSFRFVTLHAIQRTSRQVLGELAQLGERLVCNQEVTGSSPVFSTNLRPPMWAKVVPPRPERGEGGRFFDN